MVTSRRLVSMLRLLAVGLALCAAVAPVRATASPAARCKRGAARFDWTVSLLGGNGYRIEIEAFDRPARPG